METELQLRLYQAKVKQKFLYKELEKAEKRLQKAEDSYYDKSTSVCNIEKIVRSLAAKVGHQKIKKKSYERN